VTMGSDTRRLALVLLLCTSFAVAAQATSEAEQRLFLDAHVGNLDGAATLRYRYSKSGTLEENYEDEVRVLLTPASAGSGKDAHVDYLSGTRALRLPDVASAISNPVVLFFLERDVREMQRLTGGQAAYFRKRVRMALADAAQVSPVELELSGRRLDGIQIVVRPYAQDALRARFPRFADKTYRFTLSPQIPGMVFEMQTVIADPAGGANSALVEERLVFTRAEP
jgi:hypothetical protein